MQDESTPKLLGRFLALAEAQLGTGAGSPLTPRHFRKMQNDPVVWFPRISKWFVESVARDPDAAAPLDDRMTKLVVATEGHVPRRLTPDEQMSFSFGYAVEKDRLEEELEA